MTTTYIEVLGNEYLVDFDYNITCKADPGKLSGPPEYCYPPEPMEYEITDFKVYSEQLVIRTIKPAVYDEFGSLLEHEVTRSSYEIDGDAYDVSPWLYDAIHTYLENDDKIYDLICDNEAEGDYYD
ncbi:MAG: hypothetical protein P4L79_09910 [Legionella sp.]|uniref:hypothetical protein n=1 Tax=Legionella sp. TaxID=459 RepID=UPI0028482AE2|nr:hypothetical protein [Legionella sp.]